MATGFRLCDGLSSPVVVGVLTNTALYTAVPGDTVLWCVIDGKMGYCC